MKLLVATYSIQHGSHVSATARYGTCTVRASPDHPPIMPSLVTGHSVNNHNYMYMYMYLGYHDSALHVLPTIPATNFLRENGQVIYNTKTPKQKLVVAFQPLFLYTPSTIYTASIAFNSCNHTIPTSTQPRRLHSIFPSLIYTHTYMHPELPY